jgi:hypothetical protein
VSLVEGPVGLPRVAAVGASCPVDGRPGGCERESAARAPDSRPRRS